MIFAILNRFKPLNELTVVTGNRVAGSVKNLTRQASSPAANGGAARPVTWNAGLSVPRRFDAGQLRPMGTTGAASVTSSELGGVQWVKAHRRRLAHRIGHQPRPTCSVSDGEALGLFADRRRSPEHGRCRGRSWALVWQWRERRTELAKVRWEFRELHLRTLEPVEEEDGVGDGWKFALADELPGPAADSRVAATSSSISARWLHERAIPSTGSSLWPLGTQLQWTIGLGLTELTRTLLAAMAARKQGRSSGFGRSSGKKG